MIQWITEMVNWTYDIKAEAVVISKSGGSFKGRAALETKFFEVTQGTINRMTGGAGGADDPGRRLKLFWKELESDSMMVRAINLFLMVFK